MLALPHMSQFDLRHKRVMIREDFNVPMQDGIITNDRRIHAALPTLQYALAQEAAVIITSHLGRPKAGEFDKNFSLAPVANRLSELLNRPVRFISQCLEKFPIAPGEIVLCENVRFNAGETSNDESLAKRMAALCDVFVMDAFGSAHRAHASTAGVAQYAPIACAGPLLLKEVEALSRVINQPARPLLAIVGGSKISTKLPVLRALIEQVDQLIVGGGLANTLIAAAGLPIGNSLYEPDLMETAKELLALAEKKGTHIPLPVDVIVAKTCDAQAQAEVKTLAQLAADDKILDMGPQTSENFRQNILQAKTILWNGPVGVFEIPLFAAGTEKLAHAIAASSAYSIAGGGDTLAAIDQFDVSQDISFISTGGGAFLEFIADKTLPVLAILEKRTMS